MTTLPPSFVHSSLLLFVTQPVPLQLFWPLHSFLAELHSEVPLHELTPEQCTPVDSAATDTVVMPALNNTAAAAANAALDALLICIVKSSMFVVNTALLLLVTIDPANDRIITRMHELMPKLRFYQPNDRIKPNAQPRCIHSGVGYEHIA